MRDLLLLVIVGAMFVYGYFVMDRLDRFLENVHPEEELPEKGTKVEISPPTQVENQCRLCYNEKCKKRVQYLALAAADRRNEHGNNQAGPGPASARHPG